MSEIYLRARKQLRKIYVMNLIGNLSLAGVAWVALLAARGFSMMEIMMAETVFHIVSIVAEIPSGMFADVFGRKRSLIVSCVCSISSAISMGFIDCYGGVLLSIAFSALSYNFCSGTDNALAYDSLKEAGAVDEYENFSSMQTIIYRVGSSIASLCAGLALLMGNRRAQLLSVGIATAQLFIILSMKENDVIVRKQALSYRERLKDLIRQSVGFLRSNPNASVIIFGNGFVGAIDVLLLFSLQSKLQDAGANKLLLGPLLFVMYLGGVAGALLSPRFRHARFRRMFLVTALMVISGAAAALTGNLWIMTIGGIASAFADDIIQIRADVELNNMVPAEARATLISVNSLCFSIIMIVMSPLAGIVFS